MGGAVPPPAKAVRNGAPWIRSNQCLITRDVIVPPVFGGLDDNIGGPAWSAGFPMSAAVCELP